MKEKSDLQGLTQLITDATIGITDLVEAMHNRIVHPPMLPSTPVQNLITKVAGITFNTIRHTTRLVSSGTEIALGNLSSVIGNIDSSEKSEALNAVLNGVIGDYLEENDNPLQIKMQFRHEFQTVLITKKQIKKVYPAISSNILLMIHGSCMNDRQWTRKEHNHGLQLAAELGKTPIFLYYNSGRHVSINGQELSSLLENLIEQWPVKINELTILSHSMGGLVARSAVHYGKAQNKLWPKKVKKVVFLGTPHNGAPLEKAGNIVDIVLESIPYAKPFARLGKIRSAGVTDLRYGNLVDEDWQGSDRFEMKSDRRQSLPLSDKIDFYAVAGVASKQTAPKASKILGDNLVTLESAFGKHKDPNKNLSFKEENTFVVYECNHVELLSKIEVYEKIKAWLI